MTTYDYGYLSGQEDYIYLCSSDLVLDIDNQNAGPDLLRRIFGSFYYYTTDDENRGTIQTFSYNVENITNMVGRTIRRAAPEHCQQIEYAEINPTRIETINTDVDIPNLKIPIRLYAPKDEKVVFGDYHWKQFLFGGPFAGEQLPPRLNSETVYYDTSMVFAFPIDFASQRAYQHTDTPVPTTTTKFNISSNYYEYNQNVQKYQDWSSNLDSELLIPNYNILSEYCFRYKRDIEIEEGPAPGLGEDRTAMLEQAGYIESKNKTVAYHFPVGNYFEELGKDQYFGTFFPETNTNSLYKGAVINSQQNVMFDQHYFDFLGEGGARSIEELLSGREYAINEKLSNFFNVQIKFDRHTNIKAIAGTSPTGDAGSLGSAYSVFNNQQASAPFHREQQFRHLIRKSGFSSKFLEILKDIDEGTVTDIPTKTLPFNYALKRRIFGENGGFPSTEYDYDVDRPNTPVGLSSMNFLDFLSYSYNNYDVALNDNYVFIGDPSDIEGYSQRAATTNDDTLYRTINSTMMVDLIDGTKDMMKSYMRQIDPRTAPELSDLDIEEATEMILSKLYGPTFKHTEVIAYKIEKFGGVVTGDSSEQNIIQKFWIFNDRNAPPELSIFDSQVKYGKDYTYKITAYTLVMGHKYKYGDFRLTKQIGAADYLGDDDKIEYCLQFYNPENDTVAPQLFGMADLTLPEDSPLRTVLSGLNDFATNSVEISDHPQLADFHLYVEPCIELVEIPFFQKTLKVVDNPCNSINVSPFHFIDNSNRIGFQINQESFIKRPYPELITSQDLSNKLDYLKSKELEMYNLVEKVSQSPARYVEVYRISKKPNSFADFKDSLVATIDLRINKEAYNFSNKIISDQVNANKVYYYVFRFVNENGNHGPLSQIIQCELVNDGGYSYALFDTVDSSDFNPNKVTAKTASFKKLMQIDPNLAQMYFDDSAVEYEDFAPNQIDNLEVGIANQKIWDKKFKIRLTSKKTSKKLDLNLSYNLIERNLSKTKATTPPPTDYIHPTVPTLSTLDLPPSVISRETGAEDLGKIDTYTPFGPDMDPESSVIDIDAGETEFIYGGSSDWGGGDIEESEVIGDDGEISYEPVRDGTVGADDVYPPYAGYGITTGAGFPVSVYQWLAAIPHAWVEGSHVYLWDSGDPGGYTEVQALIYDDSIYDKGGNDFTPEYAHAYLAMHRLAMHVYNHRNAERMLVPLDKKLAIACTLYLLNLVGVAIKELHGLPSGDSLVYPTWRTAVDAAALYGDLGGTAGERFARYAEQIETLFNDPTKPYSNPDNYNSLEDSPFLPVDFDFGVIETNLGLAPGVIEARAIGDVVYS